MFIVTILLALANISGIGGGGLIIPIAISNFGFPTREAIAVSNSTIFLGGVARFFLYSIYEKHPHNENKMVIDHSITSIMIPMVLVGSYMGVMLNVLLPEVALAIILTLLLAYLTYSTTNKGLKLWAIETVDNKRGPSYKESEEELEKEGEQMSLIEKPTPKKRKGKSEDISEDAENGIKKPENTP